MGFGNSVDFLTCTTPARDKGKKLFRPTFRRIARRKGGAKPQTGESFLCPRGGRHTTARMHACTGEEGWQRVPSDRNFQSRQRRRTPCVNMQDDIVQEIHCFQLLCPLPISRASLGGVLLVYIHVSDRADPSPQATFTFFPGETPPPQCRETNVRLVKTPLVGSSQAE